ncbi:Serine/threonine protein kinase [Handroanthus impetiginosus]|uniref:Serine/threonine protein kinase n=1 Tax=Handroanthus impetiginosus TaxID=429701 RepID=A0A2G9I5E0_9LAMI|nr:Serine/threonine protein kinase [Handroanthus impetiginosus]
MSSIYDNWERLVEATLKREQFRELAGCKSLSSRASDFSCDSSRESGAAPPDISIRSYSGKAKCFSHSQLKYATRNFQPDNLLAEDATGIVYKGWIDEHTLNAPKLGSGLAVAVKLLMDEEVRDMDKWLNEVDFLGQLCHPNIAKIIGYCTEYFYPYLVYEFMPKGSLRDHLFKSGLNWTLSWDTTISVAIGVAQSLSFLHDRELIHGNVKSSSILLDEDFSAKLSGFTLAKVPRGLEVTSLLGSRSPRPPGHSPHIFSSSKVSYVYYAPECILTGELTPKCDVYSFGVVLTELLCGRCASELKDMFGGEEDMVEWARPCLMSNQKFSKIMDTKFGGKYCQQRVYTVVADLVLQCVSSDPEERPCMKEALDALEKIQGPKTRI